MPNSPCHLTHLQRIYPKNRKPSIMDELDKLEERIIREIEQTEKQMSSKDLREDSDRFMPKIDMLNWALNEDTCGDASTR